MEHAKLTALEVERAHRSGKRLLLGDGDGLYLRKQTGGWIEAEIRSWLADRITTSRGSVDLPIERSDSAQRFTRNFTSHVSPR